VPCEYKSAGAPFGGSDRHIRPNFVGPPGVGGPGKVWRGRSARGREYIWYINAIPSLRSTTIPAVTMGRDASSSIFQDGQLKPGIYKIRNTVSKTYVATKGEPRQLCGRPSTCLVSGEGEVRPLHDLSPMQLRTEIVGNPATWPRVHDSKGGYQLRPTCLPHGCWTTSIGGACKT